MKRNKAILVYLLGTFSQIVSVCLLFFLLNHFSVQSNLLSILGIFLGGISSALWGTIVANHYFHIHFKKIVKDFFNIHTSYKHYLLSFFLIVLDFSFLMFGGKIVEFSWYLPFLIFFKFIVFGGIEEIGWRYVCFSTNFTREATVFSLNNPNLFQLGTLASVVLLHRWFPSNSANSTVFIWIADEVFHTLSSLYQNKESLDLRYDTFDH